MIFSNDIHMVKTYQPNITIYNDNNELLHVVLHGEYAYDDTVGGLCTCVPL